MSSELFHVFACVCVCCEIVLSFFVYSPYAHSTPFSFLSSRWVKHATRKCPTCALLIERSVGCNRMTCRCGVPFCWVCVETFDSHGYCDCMRKRIEEMKREQEAREAAQAKAEARARAAAKRAKERAAAKKAAVRAATKAGAAAARSAAAAAGTATAAKRTRKAK